MRHLISMAARENNQTKLDANGPAEVSRGSSCSSLNTGPPFLPAHVRVPQLVAQRLYYRDVLV
jgi:hypothetical protein